MLLNQVYGIIRSIFRTLEFFASIGGTVAKIREKSLIHQLKLGLWHYLFYFLNFGGYFASIGCTVAMMRVKSFIRRL